MKLKSEAEGRGNGGAAMRPVGGSCKHGCFWLRPAERLSARLLFSLNDIVIMVTGRPGFTTASPSFEK